MKTVLVTGASGFCGVHLVRKLRTMGSITIIGTGRRAASPAMEKLDGFVRLDISDPIAVETLVSQIRPDSIFHLAGQFRGSDTDIYKVNTLGTANLLSAVHKTCPCAAVLIAGSSAEYGVVPTTELPVKETCPCRPRGALAISKYAATLMSLDYARQSQMKIVVTRAFNIIGPGMPASLMLGAVISRLKNICMNDSELPLLVGRLDTERDFVGIDDVTQAYVEIISGDHWGEIINLCSGVPHSLQALLDMLLAIVGKKVHVQCDPALIRPDDVPQMYGSCEKANRLFGFTPHTSIREIVEATWNAARGTVAA